MTTYDIVDMSHGNYAFPEGYRLKSVENEEEMLESTYSAIYHNIYR